MKSTAELKFLLTLLGCTDYRSLLGAACFKSFTGKSSLCQTLGDRGWVEYSQEIASVKLLPAGKSLLRLDTANLPIDPDSLQLLGKLADKSGKVALKDIATNKIKTTAAKQEVLQKLADRGFVELTWKMQKAKCEVWLTPPGLEYLREDYQPKGTAPAISLNLLGHYLKFLRSGAVKASSDTVFTAPIDDAGIVALIQSLDTELGTENYLPIFHLRQALSMTRNDCDQALYRLQKTDQIELSALQETDAYTSSQIDAGIAQTIGGPLFFISLA
jgi:hypothetical protein